MATLQIALSLKMPQTVAEIHEFSGKPTLDKNSPQLIQIPHAKQPTCGRPFLRALPAFHIKPHLPYSRNTVKEAAELFWATAESDDLVSHFPTVPTAVAIVAITKG